MPSTWKILSRLLLSMAALLCLTLAVKAEPTEGEKPAVVTPPVDAKPKPPVDEQDRVSVEVARDRAKLMHDIYSATLDVMHHRYFHGEKAAIPARAMEDIFAEMKLQSKSEARWISVNLRAMSIDHEPETEFEKKAAREITAGKKDIEEIEDGYYRRAMAIPLTGGCISCHEGSFRAPSKTSRFAGLVISIPIKVAAGPASGPAAEPSPATPSVP